MNPLDNAIVFHESMCPVMPFDSDNDELRDIMEEALDSLTQFERLLLIYRNVEEMTFKQIAELFEMRCSNKVRQLHARAWRKMHYHHGRNFKLVSWMTSEHVRAPLEPVSQIDK